MEKSAAGVGAYLEAVVPAVRRRDAATLLEMMTRITGESPAMWGPSIIGFGAYHYKYASGREGDAPAAGFSPRKAAATVYLADGTEAYAEQLEQLGAHTTGVVCLYLKDLSKVDLGVLEDIVRESYERASRDGFGIQ
ncbi:DUF1801 domain-containing protein [Arthrobacter luteolus]|uniref:DUF1801 domain-containing protein n=1 Tax=Arthrobacter luteolus TaxID=98672 RepID=UPI0008295A14|nr:DUF1801 domain-containing protein [Arthrobacter luteolus]